jgi:hypothetical protein
MLPFPKDANPEMVDLVKWCCQYEPADRPSFEEIVKKLEDIAHANGIKLR